MDGGGCLDSFAFTYDTGFVASGLPMGLFDTRQDLAEVEIQGPGPDFGFDVKISTNGFGEPRYEIYERLPIREDACIDSPGATVSLQVAMATASKVGVANPTWWSLVALRIDRVPEDGLYQITFGRETGSAQHETASIDAHRGWVVGTQVSRDVKFP